MSRELPHTCHALGCFVPVPPAMWGCRAHWAMVPRKLQRALWAEYVDGQETTKTPTAAYLRAAARCVESVAQTEGFASCEIAKAILSYEIVATKIESGSP